MRQHRPFVYQEINGARQEVPGGYVYREEDDLAVGFEVSAYDVSRPLLIDPVLSYSTYLGGSALETGSETGRDIAVDGSGNAVITGATASADFPAIGPYTVPFGLEGPRGGQEYDVFVAKFNASGSGLIYSTYLGGSRTERGFAVTVDDNGNAYVTGQTNSPGFVTTAGAFMTPWNRPYKLGVGGSSNDVFVTKLNPTGSLLLYSTYIVGDNLDVGTAIAVERRVTPM